MKTIFKIFLFFSCVSLIFSQVEHKLPIIKVKVPYIGFYFNPGKSSMKNDEETKTDELSAFQKEFSFSTAGGVYVGYRFSKKFLAELGGGIASFQQKFSGKDSLQEPFLIAKKVSYAEIYLLPKYQISLRPDSTYLTFGLGYSQGILLGASEEINNQPIDISEGEISVIDLYNRFVYGIVFELGIEQWLSNSISFSATINYKRYFNDIENKKIKWFDPLSRTYERYYENYYTEAPVGKLVREGLGLNKTERSAPTKLSDIGLNLRINYYFIKK